jgi:UDP-glucose 6-dehydrogenase
VNILEPRDGIGGHCLPKDTKMFLQSSKSIRSKILASAIEVDEDYRRYRQQKNMVLQPKQALFSRKRYDDNNIGET